MLLCQLELPADKRTQLKTQVQTQNKPTLSRSRTPLASKVSGRYQSLAVANARSLPAFSTVATGILSASFWSLPEPAITTHGRYRYYISSLCIHMSWPSLTHFVLQPSPRRWYPRLVATKLFFNILSIANIEILAEMVSNLRLRTKHLERC